MDIRDEIETLARLYPVIGQLPSSLRRGLEDASYLIQAGNDEVLFDVDAPIQYFIMLTEGSVRVILSGFERELLLYRLMPGGSCVISICHMLDDTRYRARGVVESAIRGVALPQPLFKKMLEQSPAFSYSILHAFSDQYTQLLELLDRVTSMRLDQRLARLLISRGMIVRATHSQLADDLGSVREVISRILKEFEEKGWIKLDRGYIQILEQEALQKMARISDPGHRLP